MAQIDRYLSTALLMSICLVAFKCAQAQTATTGSVLGTITNDKGKALIAVVTAAKMTAPAASGRAQSAPDGSFGFDNLPAGEYALCAQAPGGGFVDSCHWSPVPQAVTVKAGQSIIGVQIRVATGSVLHIRLNDPGEFIGSEGRRRGARHDGGTQLARLVPTTFLAGKDAAGRNHEVTIPLDTPLKFHIFSKHVRINDENGVAVDSAGSTFTIQHATGAPRI